MVVFSSRMIVHSVIDLTVAIRRGCPARQPSPQNSSGPRIATTASFPCPETTVTLTFALLDVEHGVRGIALLEDSLILAILGYGSALADLGEKGLGIEPRSSSGGHNRASRRAAPNPSTGALGFPLARRD